jgi:hypothetical protein
METNKGYVPRHAVHPFEILKEELVARNISQKEFAKRIDMQPSNFNRLLKSEADVSFEFALRLEKELDIPAEHWIKYMKAYVRDKELIAARDETEAKAIAEEAAYNERICVKEFYRKLNLSYKSIIEKVAYLEKYRRLIFNPESAFSLGSFKKSEKRVTDSYHLLTWIIIATAMADQITEGLSYINGNARKAAVEIADVANKGLLNIENVAQILNKYGIGYAHLGKLEKTPVDAYSTLRNGVPVIIATYRINDRDKFAFDILHELGHIILHIETGIKENFINIFGESEEYGFEKEADSFAKDSLIPPAVWKDIMTIPAKRIYPEYICKLIGEKAKKMGFNPTIAVSRYKHESNIYNVRTYRSQALI